MTHTAIKDLITALGFAPPDASVSSAPSSMPTPVSKVVVPESEPTKAPVPVAKTANVPIIDVSKQLLGLGFKAQLN